MTKILPTIGPATQDIKKLKFILKFTDYVRLNGAHNNLTWHKKISNNLKKLNSDINILLDFPGVKPRTSNHESIKIKKNQKVIFFYNKKIKNLKNCLHIKITNPFPKFTKKFVNFSVSDGKYKFKVVKISSNYILAKSLSDFYLGKQKGVNFPLSVYNEKVQIKKYLKFFYKTNGIKYDAIGLSYVQSKNLIQNIRKNKINKIIISKIENLSGLRNIREITEVSDAIMIDRGDLSAEIGEMNLYKAIKKISQVANEFGKPLIMATENLDSMILDNSMSSPTKSDIISLEISRDLGADRIMLSDETATSKNWKNIISWLNKFLSFKDLDKNNLTTKYEIFWNALSKFEHLPLILFTKKGYALKKLKHFNYKSLFIFTENKRVKNIYSLKEKITCKLINNFKINDNSFIFKNIKKFKKDIFKQNEIALLINITSPKKNSRANSLSLISKKDF
tara:strand:- start:626 stop:1975 length:1350 start_codon:yes stop_codon:yes gene_type:complete